MPSAAAFYSGLVYALKAIVLRYFNAAGADPENADRESHDPETHLIPLLLDAASGRRKSVTVFGTDYPTHDGTCVRDYIHVSDLAEAHIKALRALLDGCQSSIYNLGNGHGYWSKSHRRREHVIGLTVPVVLAIDGRAIPPLSSATPRKRAMNWDGNRNLHELMRSSAPPGRGAKASAESLGS